MGLSPSATTGPGGGEPNEGPDLCDLHVPTALREADVRCRDDILPKLDRIQQLMEKYDEVTIHPLSSYQADGIRQKEMG